MTSAAALWVAASPELVMSIGNVTLLWPDTGCVQVQAAISCPQPHWRKIQQHVRSNHADVICEHHSIGPLASDRWMEMEFWEANLWRSLAEIHALLDQPLQSCSYRELE